jgi:hypothetical protein
VSAYSTQRTRPGVWHSSATPISTVVFSTSTDDPPAIVQTLPAPTLSLTFGGKDHGGLTLFRAEAARKIAALSASYPGDKSGPAYGLGDRDKPVIDHPHRIEMSIDSLANHLLVEPIPVAIDPVGDDAYTAWVHNLDTNATGQSVVEALLMLKERIELVYDDLNGQQHLTAEQKLTLQILHTYIAPKKPEWV